MTKPGLRSQFHVQTGLKKEFCLNVIVKFSIVGEGVFIKLSALVIH